MTATSEKRGGTDSGRSGGNRERGAEACRMTTETAEETMPVAVRRRRCRAVPWLVAGSGLLAVLAIRLGAHKPETKTYSNGVYRIVETARRSYRLLPPAKWGFYRSGMCGCGTHSTQSTSTLAVGVLGIADDTFSNWTPLKIDDAGVSDQHHSP